MAQETVTTAVENLAKLAKVHGDKGYTTATAAQFIKEFRAFAEFLAAFNPALLEIETKHVSFPNPDDISIVTAMKDAQSMFAAWQWFDTFHRNDSYTLIESHVREMMAFYQGVAIRNFNHGSDPECFIEFDKDPKKKVIEYDSKFPVRTATLVGLLAIFG